MAQPNETPDYLFFVKNQFMLRVEHDRNQFPDGTKVSAIISLFEAKELRSYLPPNIDGEALGITFNLFKDEQQTERQLTLFPIRSTDIDVWVYIANIQNLLSSQKKIQSFLSSQPGIQLQENSQPPILLQAAMPNWYLGASTHLGLGTGGPGRRPRPVPNQKLNTLNFVFGSAFEQQLPSSVNWNSVGVYIIDSLPPKERIEDAWKTWGSDPTKLGRFQPILQPTNILTDVYRTVRADYHYADPKIFDDTRIKGKDPKKPPHAIILRDHCVDNSQDEPNKHHNYDMSDHGLFIAGIFNSIVPQVKISAVEALNEYGVGTFESIALGFQHVSQLHTNRSQSAVINCSFTLAYPTNFENPPDSEHHQKSCAQRVYSSQDPLDQQVAKEAIQATDHLFQEVIKSISTNGIIFAAAGNDSQRNAKTPSLGVAQQARQLASTPFAIGVGALKSDLKTPASYSNEADDQVDQGFVVFGGDYGDPTFTAATDEGVISIFTGNLNIDKTPDAEGYHPSWDKVTPTIYAPDLGKMVPVPTSNNNGYAEWAGTSFATPILAATVALVCGHGLSMSQALSYVASQSSNANAPWIFDKVHQVHS